jgi:transposase InsO family protein
MRGVSLKTAYKWLSRHDLRGAQGLRDLSRTRHTQSHETPAPVRKLIVDDSKRTGAGPRQRLFLVHREYSRLHLPAVSTASAILRREGLVEPNSRSRDSALRGPASAYRAGKRPSEQWMVEFKEHFRLVNGSMCYPLTLQDDATRFVLCVDGYAVPSTEAMLGSFERIFRRHGLP